MFTVQSIQGSETRFRVPVVTFFLQLPGHACHTGMGVLNVVDGVVRRLRLGHFQVKIQVLVIGPHYVDKPGRIIADLLAQLAQGDELTGSRRHLFFIAGAEQADELHQL